VSHFRGRKLLGQVVNLPNGYTGKALCVTETSLANSNQKGNDGDDAASTMLTEQVASFDKLVIWQHESLPDATEDAYMKGIQEWMDLAETIHAP
jgi:ribonuclease H2 subunit C